MSTLADTLPSDDTRLDDSPLDEPLPEGICLGFDFGLKRIGVAVGERLLGTARPIATVSNDNGTPDWATIERLLHEWQPAILVVGLPVQIDGAEQEITRQARGFMRRLRNRSGLPVEDCDERFSSMEAQAHIAGARADGRRTQRSSRADIDGEAAAVILQRWFAGADSPDSDTPGHS